MTARDRQHKLWEAYISKKISRNLAGLQIVLRKKEREKKQRKKDDFTLLFLVNVYTVESSTTYYILR